MTFSLLAIPFFVLAGAIMAEGGMALRLVNLARVFVGWIRGGLALVNILASTFFGCISGSSVADTASIGSVMIPQMVKQGYPRVFATNLTICGLSAGGADPAVTQCGHLFTWQPVARSRLPTCFWRAYFRGCCSDFVWSVWSFWMARKRNFPRGEPISFSQSVRIVLDAFWGLVTVIIILGGILSGIFTATESAAVACVYAFCVTMFIYRDYRWK